MRLLLTTLLLLATTAVLAQPGAAQAPAERTSLTPRWSSGHGHDDVTPTAFRIVGAAKLGLQQLWRESQMAKEERVACLGGHIESDTVVVDHIRALTPQDADSMGISARRSIDECGPPEFGGTVHTHIALYDAEHPYPTFSGADRGVMDLWLHHWRMDGMFCVLYDKASAHCELLTGGINMTQHGTPYSDDPKRKENGSSQ